MSPEQQQKISEQERRLDCGTCHQEIPETVAETPEGEEYIGHYCEPTCLVDWEKPAKE